MSKVVDYIWKRREDTLLFAASLLVSLALFTQLQSVFIAEEEREFEVPLEFSNRSDDITVLQAVRRVTVRASGPQQSIANLDLSKVRAFIDLKDATAGRKRYRVEVSGPKSENLVLSAVQSYVQIEIEARVTVSIPVTVEPFGVPPESIQFLGATSEPQTVEVSGPESIMKDVQSVRALLDLSVIQQNRELSIDLEILGDGNSPVPRVLASPSRVIVRPVLSVGSTMRRMLVNPVIINQPAIGFRVTGYTLTPNQIEVLGKSSVLARHTSIDTAPIDLAGLQESRDFEVELVMPNGLTVEGGPTVTVHIEVRRN